MTTHELRSAPGLLPTYARALVPKRGNGPLPQRRLVLRDVAADPARLDRYARVCGFTRTDRLPATYPHVIAFPLAMSLMARRDFPYPLPGLVHIANRIEQQRPIAPRERLSFRVWVDPPYAHERGAAFDVLAEADDGTSPVWRSTSTYLRRGRRPDRLEPRPPTVDPPAGDTGGRAAEEPAAPLLDEHRDVPGSTGRDYAAVSGDRNPIHLHPLTARLFGFRRPIAHGMWLKAWCLAAMEDALPDAYRVDVAFRAPVLLPARARLRAAARGTGRAFDLLGVDSGREHLRGEVVAGGPR